MPDAYLKYTLGVHITHNIIAAPTKTKPDELETGRYLHGLEKSTLKNMQKAVAIAEEWLNDGQLSSGKSWDDLYTHVKDTHEASSGKGKSFIGFMAFVALTKYNETGENLLCTFATIDDDDFDSDEGGRENFRKRAKLNKDEQISIKDLSQDSPFKSRGLSIEQRMGIVELAQIQEQKWRDEIIVSIKQLSDRRTALLTERSQAIDLTKACCPQYNATYEFWKGVASLTLELKTAKSAIEKEQENSTAN